MPHMIPEYTQDPMIRVETTQGDFLVPEDVFNPDEPLECTEAHDGYIGHERETGWFCRLSAPGYLDCTEWDGPHRTREEAQDALLQQHDVCPLCGGELGEDDPDACENCGTVFAPFSRQRLAEMSYGYDLDGGGYAFENPGPQALRNAPCAVLDSGFDYVPWVFDDVDFCALECPVYAFDPCGVFTVPPPTWPESYETEDGDVYTLRASGVLNETEHDCLCLGYDEEEPDKPHPDCERCQGEGYVLSEGGAWALYSYDRSQDEDE